MGELDIGSANHLDRFYDFICLFLKPFLAFFGNGQHRGSTEGISGMHAQRVDVFNEAHSNNIIIRVTDHFQLQFLPAENGFFYQNLSHQARLQSPGADRLQFFLIIYEAASGSAHRIGRAQNNRITELLSDGKSLLHGICHFAAGHFYSEAVHRLFKFNTVFPAFDGICLYADNFYMILVQNTGLV